VCCLFKQCVFGVFPNFLRQSESLPSLGTTTSVDTGEGNCQLAQPTHTVAGNVAHYRSRRHFTDCKRTTIIYAGWPDSQGKFATLDRLGERGV